MNEINCDLRENFLINKKRSGLVHYEQILTPFNIEYNYKEQVWKLDVKIKDQDNFHIGSYNSYDEAKLEMIYIAEFIYNKKDKVGF